MDPGSILLLVSTLQRARHAALIGSIMLTLSAPDRRPRSCRGLSSGISLMLWLLQWLLRFQKKELERRHVWLRWRQKWGSPQQQVRPDQETGATLAHARTKPKLRSNAPLYAFVCLIRLPAVPGPACLCLVHPTANRRRGNCRDAHHHLQPAAKHPSPPPPPCLHAAAHGGGC